MGLAVVTYKLPFFGPVAAGGPTCCIAIGVVETILRLFCSALGGWCTDACIPKGITFGDFFLLLAEAVPAMVLPLFFSITLEN